MCCLQCFKHVVIQSYIIMQRYKLISGIAIGIHGLDVLEERPQSFKSGFLVVTAYQKMYGTVK